MASIRRAIFSITSRNTSSPTIHILTPRRVGLTAPLRVPNNVASFSSDSHTILDRVTITSLEDGITKVSLSRPDKLNSLDLKMFDALSEAALRLKDDKSVRAVILCGEGRAFCTGLDVKSILKSGPIKTLSSLLDKDTNPAGEDATVPIGNLVQNAGYLWRSLPSPVIACLHGMCYGGGMQIALGADLRFSTADCRLSIMEAKWGLIPDMSASITLRELVRIDIAKELAMTGRVILGKEAAELGLVTRCVDDPMEEALMVAREIASRSPDSVAATKRLFQETWVAEEGRCLEIETEMQKKLLATWNQLAASGRNFGLRIPYIKRKDYGPDNTE